MVSWIVELVANSTWVLAIACLLSLKSKNELVIIIITLKVADLMGHLDNPLPNSVDSPSSLISSTFHRHFINPAGNHQ